MAAKSIKERAKALLTLVETLVETPGLTWVDASNAVFSPGGPFARLFRTEAERVAFGKTAEGKRIDQLIWSLPEPAVRPLPTGRSAEGQGTMIPLPSPRRRTKTPTAQARNRRPSPNGVQHHQRPKLHGHKS